MSRELKFRAWLNEENRWTDYLEYMNGSWFGRIPGNRFDRMWFDTVNITVEQYTGLKDKNGKEIYEGDIIEHTFIDIFDNEYKEIWEVYWDEDLLSYQIRNTKSSDVYFLGGCVDSELEVIGNIHENGELRDKNNGEKPIDKP